MSKLLELIKKEPTLTAGWGNAIVALCLAFGLQLTVRQVGALYAVSIGLSSVILRAFVSPVKGST